MIHKFPEEFSFAEGFNGFTDPFRYAPHPAVQEAARIVIDRIHSDTQLHAEFFEGKMIGILVCQLSSEHPSVISSDLCYLAAFSGNVGGRSHIHGFVPPIFDLCAPQGHFKIREAEISDISHRINTLSHSKELLSLEAELRSACEARDNALSEFRIQITNNRIRRDEIRSQTSSPQTLANLTKESQHEKAELRRLKISWEEKVAGMKAQIQIKQDEISHLKAERARMSDELQDWIFKQYVVHNALGESSSIADIFASQGLVPPGGTGECAAPKLLEYAYRHGLKPIAMGEFWYGRSPHTAVRTHGHFYPSCTSKCGPLLRYMLRGIGSTVREHVKPTVPSPKIIYEDDAILVVEKPSGMPSVPGLDGRLSLEEYLTGVTAVHRLDMDTSGLMVFAKSETAAAPLREQFAAHSVRKTYMARITITTVPAKATGTIELPISADYDERPRQKVDFQQGKAAHTEYELIQINPDGTADLLLHPTTGRTHQLRVHCAHNLGLNAPIVGDLLYGGAPASRLHLHALSITFSHPVTNIDLTFTSRQLCY